MESITYIWKEKRLEINSHVSWSQWNNFYTWASPWPAELCSRTHRKSSFYPVHLFMLHWILHLVFLPCREVFFQLLPMAENLLLGLYLMDWTWIIIQPVYMRLLSLPGAWQQWPPNGMGLQAPTEWTSCKDSSPPICPSLHGCKQICVQVFAPEKPNFPKRRSGFSDGCSVDGKETKA